MCSQFIYTVIKNYKAVLLSAIISYSAAEANHGVAVDTILESTGHNTIFDEMRLHAHFIAENCTRLIADLTSLEATRDPLALTIFDKMADLWSYLNAGTNKTTFGPETDRLLAKLPVDQQQKAVQSFHSVFKRSLATFEGHIESHPAMPKYKAARILDPRRLPVLSHDIADYSALPRLATPTAEMLNDWQVYVRYPADEIPEPLDLPLFWTTVSERFPHLAAMALDVMWLPVASVDVERSFSLYKHLLNEQRESLTEANTKQLLMLYYNGDLERRLNE